MTTLELIIIGAVILHATAIGCAMAAGFYFGRASALHDELLARVKEQQIHE
jgi:hypothetical protein